MNETLRRLRAWIERLTSPGYGHCLRCKRPWSRVHNHTTHYARGGLFALCEGCWKALAPGQRWVYYQRLIAMWPPGYCTLKDVEEIHKAVIEGK